MTERKHRVKKQPIISCYHTLACITSHYPPLPPFIPPSPPLPPSIPPPPPQSQICSGQGKCSCNTCVNCKEPFTGRYCHSCMSTLNQCTNYYCKPNQPCAMCAVGVAKGPQCDKCTNFTSVETFDSYPIGVWGGGGGGGGGKVGGKDGRGGVCGGGRGEYPLVCVCGGEVGGKDGRGSKVCALAKTFTLALPRWVHSCVFG